MTVRIKFKISDGVTHGMNLFFVTEFDVRFNPDIYAPGIKHASSEVSGFKN